MFPITTMYSYPLMKWLTSNIDDKTEDDKKERRDDISKPLSISQRHPECQYLELIENIMEYGSLEETRNGMTYSSFGNSMRFSLNNGTLPIITTKKVAWRICFEELFWFIRGCTSNQALQEKNVHIWNGNASREFLDSRNLFQNLVGDLGPVYGFQWRHFNANYVDCNTDYTGQGIDQLQYIIDTLKNPETRNSRRLILTAWNPCQLNQMALPPCHMMAQFSVRENKYLSCALYQRSGDVGLGVPFNITSYSLLTHLIAHHCGLEAGEFVHFLGDCHIYVEHIQPLKKQIQREPIRFPKISIRNKRENIEDYNIDDIEFLTPYISNTPIKMEMKV